MENSTEQLRASAYALSGGLQREARSFFFGMMSLPLKPTLIQFTFGLECLRSLQKDGQTFHDFLAHSQVVFSENALEFKSFTFNNFLQSNGLISRPK